MKREQIGLEISTHQKMPFRVVLHGSYELLTKVF